MLKASHTFVLSHTETCVWVLFGLTGPKRGPWSFMDPVPFAPACPKPRTRSLTSGACSTATMKPTLLIFSLLACLVSEAAATALTFFLPTNDKACFFAVTKKDTEKIAFYFAVRSPPRPPVPPDSMMVPVAYARFCSYRSNPAARSMSTTRSPALATRSFWMGRRSGKGTLSLRPTLWETTSSASATR